MAGSHYPGDVCHGTPGHGTDKSGCDKRDAVYFYSADSLFPDSLPDVPDDESHRNAFIQELSERRTDQRLAADRSYEFPHGALLADLFCRTGRQMDLPETIPEESNRLTKMFSVQMTVQASLSSSTSFIASRKEE